MENIISILHPGIFLIGFIPVLIISFFLLKKFVFQSAPKNNHQLLFKIVRVVVIELLISIMIFVLAILSIIVFGLGGGLLSAILLPHIILGCIIVTIIAIFLLILEIKNKKISIYRTLTKTNLLITVLILMVLVLLLSIFINYK